MCEVRTEQGSHNLILVYEVQTEGGVLEADVTLKILIVLNCKIRFIVKKFAGRLMHDFGTLALEKQNHLG